MFVYSHLLLLRATRVHNGHVFCEDCGPKSIKKSTTASTATASEAIDGNDQTELLSVLCPVIDCNQTGKPIAVSGLHFELSAAVMGFAASAIGQAPLVRMQPTPTHVPIPTKCHQARSVTESEAKA